MPDIAPHEWRQLSQLLDTALDMDEREREAWLDMLSRDATPLASKLRELLQQHARFETSQFVIGPPDVAAALCSREHSAGAADGLAPGECVGPYRLIRQLGRGGMAQVWSAERVDGLVRRRVALKLPYTTWGVPWLWERAVREREILSALEHPNIARLYDGGLTSDNRPYLALELVEGRPLDVYCNEQSVDLAGRLRILLQIARAIAYAHARLVVHRDLKPSNILIDAQGQVHLLDFGIGKLLDGELADVASPTRLGGTALTPEYSSPEQLLGQPVSTGTDVYSLGVVMYELLSGQRPYDHDATFAAKERAMAQVEPPPPSARCTDRARARRLRGDLDTIVLKALRKDPSERYATMAAFADDVEHYLRGEPVTATRGSVAYRARKFVMRNRLAVGASAAIILTLGVGLAVALHQLQVARTERERAEQVKEFVASIFRSADPYFTGKQSMSAAELIALARTRVDEDLAEQPQMAVELLSIVGESQVNLEQHDAARDTLEKAIARGKRELPRGSRYVAEAQARLALLNMNSYDLDSAEPLLAQAIPVLRAAGSRGARVLSESLHMQANIEAQRGHADRAIELAEEAVAIATRELGPTNSETILGMAHLANQYFRAQRFADSLRVASQAWRAAQVAFPAGSHNGVLVEARSFYGRALLESGKPDEGLSMMRAALRDALALYGEKNVTVSAMLSDLARAQSRVGDMRGMVESTRQMVESALNEQARVYSMATLGHAQVLARDFRAARQALGPALAALRRLEPAESAWISTAEVDEALAIAYAGNTRESRERLQRALAAQRDATTITAISMRTALGRVELLEGDIQSAAADYARVLSVSSDAPPVARFRSEALTGVALQQLADGEAPKAEATLRQADAAARIASVNLSPLRADVLVAQGRVALTLGKTRSAADVLEQAYDFWQRYDAESPYAAEAAFWYGKALSVAGRAEEGHAMVSRSRGALEHSQLAYFKR